MGNSSDESDGVLTADARRRRRQQKEKTGPAEGGAVSRREREIQTEKTKPRGIQRDHQPEKGRPSQRNGTAGTARIRRGHVVEDSDEGEEAGGGQRRHLQGSRGQSNVVVTAASTTTPPLLRRTQATPSQTPTHPVIPLRSSHLPLPSFKKAPRPPAVSAPETPVAPEPQGRFPRRPPSPHSSFSTYRPPRSHSRSPSAATPNTSSDSRIRVVERSSDRSGPTTATPQAPRFANSRPPPTERQRHRPRSPSPPRPPSLPRESRRNSPTPASLPTPQFKSYGKIDQAPEVSHKAPEVNHPNAAKGSAIVKKPNSKRRVIEESDEDESEGADVDVDVEEEDDSGEEDDEAAFSDSNDDDEEEEAPVRRVSARHSSAVAKPDKEVPVALNSVDSEQTHAVAAYPNRGGIARRGRAQTPSRAARSWDATHVSAPPPPSSSLVDENSESEIDLSESDLDLGSSEIEIVDVGAEKDSKLAPKSAPKTSGRSETSVVPANGEYELDEDEDQVDGMEVDESVSVSALPDVDEREYASPSPTPSPSEDEDEDDDDISDVSVEPEPTAARRRGGPRGGRAKRGRGAVAGGLGKRTVTDIQIEDGEEEEEEVIGVAARRRRDQGLAEEQVVEYKEEAALRKAENAKRRKMHGERRAEELKQATIAKLLRRQGKPVRPSQSYSTTGAVMALPSSDDPDVPDIPEPTAVRVVERAVEVPDTGIRKVERWVSIPRGMELGKGLVWGKGNGLMRITGVYKLKEVLSGQNWIASVWISVLQSC
ncbi:hypothetical protein HDU93_003509 [Gonapodya sp. JEL0774]|nr:hypothetical protein HDU93_003509 [Gonapodya sp. JEL0774]